MQTDQGEAMPSEQRQSQHTSAQPRLLDRVREGIRRLHYSRRTEEAYIHWTKWIMASLIYGAGLRLRECLTLRVKDVDFGYRQILVR